MNTRYFLLMGMALCMLQGHAQGTSGSNANKKALEQFRKETREKFESFRQEAMNKYLDFMRNPWKEFNSDEPLPVPKNELIEPVQVTNSDLLWFKKKKKKKVEVNEVVTPPKPKPQPKPVEPIREVPMKTKAYADITFFGTPVKVRYNADGRIKVKTVNPAGIADAMKALSSPDNDNMIVDCLAERDRLQLCDWAYLLMLKALSDRIYGQDTNEATLLLAYLYMQSGYRMRLAYDDINNKVYMLYASQHIIYEQGAINLNNESYYCLGKMPHTLFLCEAPFPKEKNLSLMVTTNQRFAMDQTGDRVVKSEKYNNVCLDVKVNKNLLDFYDTYPTSMIGDNQMTRWAMYANKPMEETVKEKAYPALKQQLAGLSQKEAVECLLNLIQTGLEYKLDDLVWGHDRAFFPEESLFYPYCDCEDRSILFTRLVRDLVGLECLLVYYPRHLAAAVAFTDEVEGDYIELNGKKFTIADPTYVAVSMGRTMPKMDNSTAKVIVLQ